MNLKGWRMIEMTVLVQLRPGKEAEFLQAIRSLNRKGETNPGAWNPSLYRAVEDACGFRLSWEWQTRDQMELYRRSDDCKVILGAVRVLGERSEIRFCHVLEKAAVLPGV